MLPLTVSLTAGLAGPYNASQSRISNGATLSYQDGLSLELTLPLIMEVVGDFNGKFPLDDGLAARTMGVRRKLSSVL